MENKFTKVMWLEENPFIIDKFLEKAVDYELNLEPFTCWEDAKRTLVSNLKGWGAIILDPKCKLGLGDRPRPQKFLPQVLCDITDISAKYNAIIPWYVFTDLEPNTFEDLIVNNREVFDAEWERPYYNMDEDANYLFKRIKMQTSSIARTKIRSGVHKELFDTMSALTTYGITNEDISTMEDIFISIYDNKESKRCNFINIRKIIESIIKSMIVRGFLPNNILNQMGEFNYTGYARLLAGFDCYDGSDVYKQNIPIINKVAGENLKTILKICHGYAHSESVNVSTKRTDTNHYLELANTNNLLYASAFMLADVIIMYWNFLLDYKDNTEETFWTKTKCEQKLHSC